MLLALVLAVGHANAETAEANRKHVSINHLYLQLFLYQQHIEEEIMKNISNLVTLSKLVLIVCLLAAGASGQSCTPKIEIKGPIDLANRDEVAIDLKVVNACPDSVRVVIPPRFKVRFYKGRASDVYEELARIPPKSGIYTYSSAGIDFPPHTTRDWPLVLGGELREGLFDMSRPGIYSISAEGKVVRGEEIGSNIIRAEHHTDGTWTVLPN